MYDDLQSCEPFAPRLFRAVALIAIGAALHIVVPFGSVLPVPEINPVKFANAELQLPAHALSIRHVLVFARPAAELERSLAPDHGLPAVGTSGRPAVVSPALLAGLPAVPVEPLPAAVSFNLARFVDGSTLELDLAVSAPALPEPVTLEVPPTSPDGSSDAAADAAILRSAPPALEPLERVPTSVMTAATRTAPELNEEDLVRQLLDAYSGAVSRLDVDAMKAVFPSVDGKALERAYGRLSAQRLTLQSCGITISGSTANARCRGNATYQPRIGRRSVEIAAREWTFDLSKQGTAWHIVNTFVR